VGNTGRQAHNGTCAPLLQVDERDDQGCTPLHFAADRGAEQAAQMLLAAGAQVRLPPFS